MAQTRKRVLFHPQYVVGSAVVVGFVLFLVYTSSSVMPPMIASRQMMSLLQKLPKPTPLRNRYDFQPVPGTSQKLFAYSALWGVDDVRIIAIKERKAEIKNLFCEFRYSSGEKLVSPGKDQGLLVRAEVDNIPEHHNALYSAAYIKCPLKEAGSKAASGSQSLPITVSLFTEESLMKGLTLTLPVEGGARVEIHTEARGETGGSAGNGAAGRDDGIAARKRDCAETECRPETKVNADAGDAGAKQTAEARNTTIKGEVVEFTVCVPPLHGYKKTEQLVEKLEMSRLLGAGRVVFYNSSISPDVDSVLRMYMGEWQAGQETLEIVVLPWPLPVVSGTPIARESDIHYFGQLAAVNDCLHRYRLRTFYTVFIDLDEFIAPLEKASWSQLIAHRERVSPKSFAFLFRNTVFNTNFFSPAKGLEAEATMFGSAVLGITQRDQEIFPPLQRSKVIVNPRKVQTMGIHFAFSAWTGSVITDNVPTNEGLLCHYRTPLLRCKPQVEDVSVVDKFGKRLATRLKDAWSKLPGVAVFWKPGARIVDKKNCSDEKKKS